MTRKAQAATPPAAPPPRLALAVALLLALAGLAVSLVLVRLHAQAHAGIASFCAISETVNCDKVAMSPFSMVFRLPVAVWGALGYGLAAALAGWGLTARRLHRRWPAGLLFLFGGAAVVASVALALISELLIGAWCILCMVSWAISLAMLVTALLACRGAGLAGAVRADLAALAAMPRRTSGVIVVGLAGLLVLASYYPRYWERARAEANLTRPPPGGPGVTGTPPAPAGPLVDPAVGAIVFSDYECPYCLVAHGELRAVLARRPDIKVVKRHFPLDQACNPVIKRPIHQRACEYARAAICAEAQGHFDAMDDALFQNQRGQRPVEELAGGLGLDVPRFQACLAAPETAQRLQADIAAALKADVKATPTYLVGGVQYAGKLPVEVFRPAAGAPAK
jgi:protein-disulfide isomerase